MTGTLAPATTPITRERAAVPAAQGLSPAALVGESQADLDRLALSRRIDWRFLLPDPDLADVAFLGAPGPLLDALRAFSRSVTLMDPLVAAVAPPAAPSGAHTRFDLLVLTNPDPPVLRRSAALLKPGGWLYIELARPADPVRRILSRGSLNRLLAELRRSEGFDHFHVHWHWPDHEHTTTILPLDDPPAVIHHLQTRAGPLTSRMLAAVERLSPNGRLLRLFARHVSLLAHRRREVPTTDSSPPPESGVVRLLHEHRECLQTHDIHLPERLTGTLLTPRFRTSAHVIALLSPAGEGAPRLVAKLARLPALRNGHVFDSLRESNAPCAERVGDIAAPKMAPAREAESLLAFHARRPGGYDSVPRLVAFEQAHGRALLVETALTGRLVDPKLVRSNPHGCCRAVLNWLADIDRPSTSPLDDSAARWQQLVERPLARVVSQLSPESDARQFAARARALAEPLRDLPLPAVFEHGDLCHPNLLLRDDGSLAVVDWELADPAGPPAADLVFFLTFAAFARARARTPAARQRAFHRAFFEPGSWTEPHLREYLDRLQVPERAFAPLFALTWTRYLANLLLRASESKGRSSTPSAAEVPSSACPSDRAAWLRTNRYFALWRQTLEHSHRLFGQHDRAHPR